MRITNLKINGIKNPVGYAFEQISLSYLVTKTAGKALAFSRIEVSLTKDFGEILYQKEGADLDTVGIVLEFEKKPRTRYYVRVMAQADNGESAVSDEICFFETSKMDEAWTGKWIKPQKEDRFHPEFCKSFKVAADKKIQLARLYISGLGLYSAELNGQRVTDEVLTPYYSNYHYEVQYQTYDVTELISTQGEAGNEIRVTLGNGWYKGYFGLAHKKENFGSEFLLLAELHVIYEDGTEEVIGTDESWKYSGSDIEMSDIYMGEWVNRELWNRRNNPQENLWKAPVLGAIEGKLVPRYSIATVEKETMSVKEVLHTPAGETVLDFGQNFAGYVTFFTKSLSRGAKVTLDFGEILQDGNFYNANYRDAKSQFIYISDGRDEWIAPRFTFYGFRYVRVTGWAGDFSEEDWKQTFEGKAVYADMEETGFIETGHPKINRLFLNAKWGQKSNSIDFPTDCPQRDERLGWTGDAQVFSGTASYNMDTAAFYHKFIHDLRTEQLRLDGIVPGVIPVWEKQAAIFSCVWGDIATFLPTVLYEHYGDQTALAQYYPMMRGWVDKIDREDAKRGHNYLFNFENQLGDWLALDGRTPQSNEGGTDTYFIASCYYAASAKKTADAAKILGFDEDARHYEKLHDQIVEAVINEYYTPTGRLAIDTQTGYIVALHFGIYPDKQRVLEGFRERLYKDCYKLKGGFVGAPLMCRVLAENGLEEEAFYFLLQEDYPGWLHCVNLGATTIWERWNSVLDDGKLSGTMMNSLNHYSFGAVVEYLYRDVAGLKALEGGFQKVEISPLVNQKLRWMKMRYESVYGTYRSEWEILKDGRIHATVEIPFNCTALVGLPFYPEKPIGELKAGVHEFTYMPTEDMRSRYSKKTLFKDMMQDARAMEVIERVSPLLQYFLGTGNQDFLHESLTTLQNMFYMGFSKEMIDNLTEELTKIYEE